MNNLKRHEWVDIAKGIAIILVVYGHTLRGLNTANISMSEIFFRYSDSLVYSFHMPLFFILSGLFFKGTFEKQKNHFLWDKAQIILWPFALWTIIQLCLQILMANKINTERNFSELLPALLWEPLGQFWFLYALFIFFFISWGAYTSKISKPNLVLLTIGVSSNLLFMFYTPPILEFLLPNFIFFVIGIYFSKYIDITISKPTIFAMSAFALWIFLYLIWDYTGFNKHVLPVSLAGSMMVIALSFALQKNKFGIFLSYIGKNSLIIFLAHIIAGSGMRVILMKLGIDDFAVLLPTCLMAGIFLPLLMLFFIKKLNLNWIISLKPQKAN